MTDVIPTRQTHQGRIDVLKALELRTKKGLTYPEIAKYMGVTKQAVHAALKRFNTLLMQPGELDAFRGAKADLLESAEARLLNEVIDPDKMRKASINNVAYALGQVSNIARLEKGLSTSNVAYVDMSASLEELRQQRRQLEEALNDM